MQSVEKRPSQFGSCFHTPVLANLQDVSAGRSDAAESLQSWEGDWQRELQSLDHVQALRQLDYLQVPKVLYIFRPATLMNHPVTSNQRAERLPATKV